MIKKKKKVLQDIERMAESARPLEELLSRSCFCGLGAPYWDPFARGAILGLTPQVGKEELVRGALEIWLLRWETPLYG